VRGVSLDGVGQLIVVRGDLLAELRLVAASVDRRISGNPADGSSSWGWAGTHFSESLRKCDLLDIVDVLFPKEHHVVLQQRPTDVGNGGGEESSLAGESSPAGR